MKRIIISKIELFLNHDITTETKIKYSGTLDIKDQLSIFKVAELQDCPKFSCSMENRFFDLPDDDFLMAKNFLDYNMIYFREDDVIRIMLFYSFNLKKQNYPKELKFKIDPYGISLNDLNCPRFVFFKN